MRCCGRIFAMTEKYKNRAEEFAGYSRRDFVNTARRLKEEEPAMGGLRATYAVLTRTMPPFLSGEDPLVRLARESDERLIAMINGFAGGSIVAVNNILEVMLNEKSNNGKV